MLEITNIDLRYQRRARGVAALGAFGVDDDGTLRTAVPDEMETRTLHAVFYAPTGEPQISDTFHVETLRQTAVSAEGGVGITKSDLYVLRDSHKIRFLADRRVSYTDMALSGDGNRFLVAFCDLLAAGHALSLGNERGHLVWTKDIPFVINRIAISRDGSCLAAGGESGTVWVLDSWRTAQLQYNGESTITALSTNGWEDGETFFGLRGGVGCLDRRGGLQWFTRAAGEIVALSQSANNAIVGAVTALSNSAGKLILFAENGAPLWEIDYDESCPTGVSVSANGRFVGVTLRDGTVALYELDFGDGIAARDTVQMLTSVDTIEESDPAAAIEVLRRRVEAVATDTTSCARLVEALSHLRTLTLRRVGEAEQQNDFAAADQALEDALRLLPHDVELTTRKCEVQRRWVESLFAESERAMAAGDSDSAAALLREAVQVAPLDLRFREALTNALRSSAERALQRGKDHLQAGRYTDAISALLEAREQGIISSEVANLLRQARAGEAYVLGTRLYEDRQYAAAMFQFQKALRFNPQNREARQKLHYAKSFLQNTSLRDRFRRLE
ncbi:MAG: hypothetical protein OHK0029_34910 [Armatimonadaceae bacterium]